MTIIAMMFAADEAPGISGYISPLHRFLLLQRERDVRGDSKSYVERVQGQE
jgi:hypothetical protein